MIKKLLCKIFGHIFTHAEVTCNIDKQGQVVNTLFVCSRCKNKIDGTLVTIKKE